MHKTSYTFILIFKHLFFTVYFGLKNQYKIVLNIVQKKL